MTNEQKYKTAEERVRAFMAHRRYKAALVAAISNKFAHWLAREADEEKLEPCPFCDGETYVNTHSEGHEVRCKTRYCYVGKTFENKDDAIAAHNRVARAVRAALAKANGVKS